MAFDLFSVQVAYDTVKILAFAKAFLHNNKFRNVVPIARANADKYIKTDRQV